ncbi:hypothetical protein DPEC_G00258820 [Dallia pectoralis]|uniref:Uncharacterized protein n=1 Tax=Dallia pectoralis TaxID=75939 RepID=A0ACC2FQX3_DALPE|nr:hypothetical protein DPEC_G00258820 [Dallia pectoralis]
MSDSVIERSKYTGGSSQRLHNPKVKMSLQQQPEQDTEDNLQKYPMEARPEAMGSEMEHDHREKEESTAICRRKSRDFPLDFKQGASSQEHLPALCNFCSKYQAVKTCSVSLCEDHKQINYAIPVLQRHFLKTSERQDYNEDKNTTLTSDDVEIKIGSVTSDSVCLSWSTCQGQMGPQTFKMTWQCDENREASSSRIKDVYHLKIAGLQPGQKYMFDLGTESDNGYQSRTVSVSTVVPPRNLKICYLEETSFSLSWSKGQGVEEVPQSFLISCSSLTTDPWKETTKACHKKFTGLKLGTEYTVSVSTVLVNGDTSDAVSKTLCTSIPAPEKLAVDFVDTTSATVSWSQPDEILNTDHHYQISYHSTGTDEVDNSSTISQTSINLSDLEPASEYTVTVCTVLENDKKSQPLTTTFNTKHREAVRIVLVGRVGVGKSAAVNHILDRSPVQTSDSLDYLTTVCKHANGVVEGQKVLLVETPGVFHTNRTREALAEIEQGLNSSAPGPHLFLIVIPLGRSTPEEKETVKILQTIFGEHAEKYTMVLFTFGHLLGGKSIEEYMSEDLNLKNIVQKCGGYHVFTNNCQSEVIELFRKINKMIKKNGGSYYNKTMFLEAGREQAKNEGCSLQ